LKPYKDLVYYENERAQTTLEANPNLNKDDFEKAQWLAIELDRRPFFGFDSNGGGGKEPKGPSQQEILLQKKWDAEK